MGATVVISVMSILTVLPTITMRAILMAFRRSDISYLDRKVVKTKLRPQMFDTGRYTPGLEKSLRTELWFGFTLLRGCGQWQDTSAHSV